MQLTERDSDILTFINDFGFCQMHHLNQRFGLKRPWNYQILQRLTKAKLVSHERIFYKGEGIFRLTAKGAQHTPLPALKKIKLSTYQHDLTVIDVVLRLQQQYPDGTWLSERHLLIEKCQHGVGKRGHLADGHLWLPGFEKPIAIEVELSRKGKARVTQILKNYTRRFDMEAVWYFCPKNLLPSLQHTAAKMPFVKFFLVKEFLS